jgi:hypothetical protein
MEIHTNILHKVVPSFGLPWITAPHLLPHKNTAIKISTAMHLRLLHKITAVKLSTAMHVRRLIHKITLLKISTAMHLRHFLHEITALKLSTAGHLHFLLHHFLRHKADRQICKSTSSHTRSPR